MSELSVVVAALLPVLAVTALGALLRRIGWLTAAADASLLTLMVNLLTPCLIVDKVLGSAALAEPATALLAPLVGALAVVVGLAVSFAAAHAFGMRAEPARRTFALSAGVQNYGYLPLPLALLLYGNETVAVLFAHNLGSEVAIWSLGVAVLAGVPPRDMFRRMLSPPAVAIVSAVLVNFFVGRARVPGFLLESASLLGAAAIPLGLLLTGATMADHARNVWGPGSFRTAALACVLRLGILPVFYLGALGLTDAGVELDRVFVLQSAMPAAVFPILIAKHYKGDSVTALRVVFGTTLVSLVTIPLWIHFASGWVGGR